MENEKSIIMSLKEDLSEKISYNFTDFPAFICERALSRYPGYAAVSHWHNDVELIVVVSGCMKYNVNGSIETIKEGEGIFVNTRQLHFGFSDNQKECVFICILLHPMLLCTSRYIEENYVVPVLSHGDFTYCLLRKDVDWEREILAAAKMMYACREKEGAVLEVQSYFYHIWRILFEHLPKACPQEGSRHSQLSVLKDMVGYIQKHYSERILLGDIAAAGGVCKSSCCAIFQNYLKQTPVTYLTDYRLKKSIDLMDKTEMSITEIGFEVGFTGASYYAETFRKHFGCSPTQYRQGLPE